MTSSTTRSTWCVASRSCSSWQLAASSAEALALDIAGEKLADLRIVVCDENSLWRVHQMRF
jgi:hypothetical protein